MTTLYRPVLIESAEQAEALPDNTMVVHPQEWPLMFVNGQLYTESGTVTVDEIVEQGGYSVLMPIEAEEETRLHIVRSGARTTTADLTRLVTPWGEA